MILGALLRPWRRVKRDRGPETIFVMARENHKIVAYLGLTRYAISRAIVVLDTEAGSGLIKYLLIPYELQKRIRLPESQFNVRDASNRLVSIVGTINFSADDGSRSAIVNFNVVKRLGTEVLLGCGFCNAHVDAIRPKERVIELADKTTVSILKGPQKRFKNMFPIPEYREYIAPKSRPNHKVFVGKTVILQPESQN